MKKQILSTRRKFLQKLLAATAVAGFYPYLDACESGVSAKNKNKGKMPLRPLGRTGYMVGIYSLGGRQQLKHPEKRNCLFRSLTEL